LCRFCEQDEKFVIEDEYHFLIHCPTYDELRSKYLPSVEATGNRDFNKFMEIMTKNDPGEQTKVALYLYNSFKKRTKLINFIKGGDKL